MFEWRVFGNCRGRPDPSELEWLREQNDKSTIILRVRRLREKLGVSPANNASPKNIEIGGLKSKEDFMKILITGGTGLIGSALAKDLAKDQHEVIVLSRKPDKADRLPDNVTVVAWDARTANGWGKMADGADAMVNLAGENISGDGMFPSRWTEERKRRILESRVNAGKAVTEAVAKATKKPGVVIQASAIGYYPASNNKSYTENDSPGNDFQANVLKQYEDSTASIEEKGVRRVIIRSGVVLSAAGGAFVPQVLPFKMFVGGPLGSGKQGYSWIHIADEIAAIRFLIENQVARGAFNVTSPKPLSNKDFGRVLGKVMGRSSFFPVPEFALKLAFGEVSSILLEGRTVLPKRLQELGFRFRFPDAESAVHDLLGK